MHYFCADHSSNHRGVTVERNPFSSVLLEDDESATHTYGKQCFVYPKSEYARICVRNAENVQKEHVRADESHNLWASKRIYANM